MLQGGLDVGGRHPQRYRRQRLLTRQHYVPADRRPQLIQQHGPVTGRLDAHTPTVPGPRTVIRDHGPALYLLGPHGTVGPRSPLGATVPCRTVPWCNARALGTGPHIGDQGTGARLMVRLRGGHWSARTGMVRILWCDPHAAGLHLFPVSGYLLRGPCLIVGPGGALRRQRSNAVVRLVSGPLERGP
ncbi:hypothetical protein GCM10010346_53090 [Streptomyces chryseus]|uniref:Uncharacterized protein n=1 Tax=Streptomyces chryseus TaxID=68186 RepID=A0ABQ3E6R9_9ACTN|nr:hypothetical protein GCM10010346_53090 [Streptomyces chryseus]